MPRLITLKPHHIEICDNSLLERGFVAPNSEAIVSLIMANPKLVRLLKDYKSSTCKFGNVTFDTYEREELLWCLSMAFAPGLDWPCNMDGDREAGRFFTTLVDNMKKAGWAIVSC